MKFTDNSFKKEALETLNRIDKENSRLSELQWFLNIAMRRFSEAYLETTRPKLIVLGNDIPLEIIYAVSDHPFFVLGGSLAAAHWADELTPRDTDHFSRSCLGWLINSEFDITENALIVTAISSDSRRKLISILEGEGKKVESLDVPPEVHSPCAVHYYKNQLSELAAKIGKHTGKRMTGSHLRAASRKVTRARQYLGQFYTAAFMSAGVITAEAKMLVGQSLYFSDSLDEWEIHIARLIRELEMYNMGLDRKTGERPGIIIVGSPISFPNFKIPQLITSAGMTIQAMADSLSLESVMAGKKIKKPLSAERLLTQITSNHLRMTASGSRVNNDGMYLYFMHLIKQLHPEGIVCHILKGQIEYDFELPYIEKAAENAGIPIFRLETDYQYQDMEQLRIRMEAFGEMLVQRRIAERKDKKIA